VGDGDAEGVTEERGHREPVGEAADHRRFGGGAHVARPPVLVLEHLRGDEHGGGDQQQAGRAGLHGAELHSLRPV
jgi:hypothetical protein